MTNTLLTPDIILREMLLHLENEMVISKLCNRDYEQEFAGPMKPGQTIRIRRPIYGQVRTGAARVVQDVQEGNTTLTVATQIGADLDFSTVDMTLKVEDFSERYLQPQASLLANTIDLAVYNELKWHCPNWVGTPGQTVNSFADYALGPQRLDELAVPKAKRAGILAPADYWGTVGSITALSANAPVRSALEESELGNFAGTKTYQSQNVTTHTVGSWAAVSPQVDGGTQNVTYDSVRTTPYLSQTFLVKNMTASVSTLRKGDVFTIDSVYAVNPVTKDTQDFLRQFVVISDQLTADGAGKATITITPAIITSGPYQTCSAIPADSAAITVKGTSGTAYRQNIVFVPEAVTLAIPPLYKPPAAVICEQRTYKGITMRMIELYDGTNDVAGWRFDILYGTLATQPHLAARLSGT